MCQPLFVSRAKSRIGGSSLCLSHTSLRERERKRKRGGEGEGRRRKKKKGGDLENDRREEEMRREEKE